MTAETAEDRRWSRLIDQHRARQRELNAPSSRRSPSPAQGLALVWLGTVLALPGVWMASRWLAEVRIISRGVADPVGNGWAFLAFVGLTVVLLLAVSALVGGSWTMSRAPRVLIRGVAAVPACALLVCWITGLDASLGTDAFRH